MKDKKDWIEALRSGDYKQGHGRLKGDDLYCCLGVLVDVMGIDWESDSGYGWKWEDCGSFPEDKKFGLTDKEVWKLIKLNDRYNHSLDKIADYIESSDITLC